MNEVPDFVLFLGRFHPLVVHLPIGFLTFAFLLEIFSKWKNNKELRSAIPYALFFSFVTAAKACTLGYMLSLSGEYDGEMLDGHFWFGIATTVATLFAWLISIDKIKFIQLKSFKSNIASLTLLVALISITGHYGGNLTHGSDYLTKYAPFTDKPVKILPPKTMEEVAYFDHIVNPILQDKCASCHNASKKKGGLSFENQEMILKGGKKGLAVVAGDLSKSDLIHRVSLSDHDEDFMPPEGKTPLTEEEIKLISYWIESAKADFTTKLMAIENHSKILPIAASYLKLDGSAEAALPKVAAVDSLVIADLINAGFAIRELVFDAHIYDVVLPTQTASTNEEFTTLLKKLEKIKDHVFWLELEDNFVTDENLQTLTTFSNLTKLKLAKNPISDAGITSLEKMVKLESLNLYETKITASSLDSFLKFKKLKSVYLWKTSITKEELTNFETTNELPKLYLGMKK
ncbi:c-type cytochrome domain-containing protein [Flavicella sediminum]|uniref:c-type cytochrome domain-containing protein n=1 Tax=Flavicella sediminum TaxID=2585141 RepID=UPI0011237A3D|nr:c-type cytochrome domain-containing protein [Flavicella sediminum]